ncbi:proton-conducting transporter membrane subunit [Aureimonas sp. SK2]|uniref:proton-conducting transporter transmembrane domain-containing protein n=1 Tax=Aureimonas sp. SK2 TaxID=3015992 RepID=UPI002443C5AC|nr:proton-conducting transporter membrane subunit [Aureimonas sp. SK2]
MIDALSPLLILLAVALPLALALAAALPAFRARALDLLPFAPLPSLAAALLATEGARVGVPELLFGVRLELRGEGRLFLGFASFLWCLAGLYARSEMRGTQRPTLFAVSWCLALAGNLGVFLAGDVVTFYTAFACLTFAAYPAIVSSGTEAAYRAGRVYMVFSVAGETALLAALMLAASGAVSLSIGGVSASIASLPQRDVVHLLLLVGFGIKAGLVPLHLWLPLAHPAAPPAASAVLSGAMVKAGLFGLMRFMPGDGALGDAWPLLLLALGLAGCFYGIAMGLTQTKPKTILAYSTVSQMSLMVALLSAGLGEGAAGAAFGALSLYALHHGLAKGALFMGAGLAPLARPGARIGFLALLALPALSVAGLPLTGGALAKLAGKMPFSGAAETLVTLSAAGTTLVMLRFLAAAGSQAGSGSERLPAARLAPMIAATLAAVALPWWLFPALSGQDLGYVLRPDNLWSAAWPVALAAAGFLVWRRAGFPAPAVPPGDILVPLTAALERLRKPWAAIHYPPFPKRRSAQLRARGMKVLLASERGLLSWSLAGPLVLAVVLFAALYRP